MSLSQSRFSTVPNIGILGKPLASLPGCANCGEVTRLMACSRCACAKYCSKSCQTKHWPSHKLACAATSAATTAVAAGKCLVCLDDAAGKNKDMRGLQCGHSFHSDCLEALEFFGVEKHELCPLCRHSLSSGPHQECEVATRRLAVLAMRVARGHAAWKSLSEEDGAEMREVCRLFESAAASGNLAAVTNLGLLEHLGHGVPLSHAGAAARWAVAAAGGDRRAAYNLSVMYQEGKGVNQNANLAAIWARKAADQGHAEAMNSLGTMYRRGDGVVQDDVEAAAWVRRAAEQGFSKAQLHMAQLCAAGAGCAQDDAAAAAWLKKAADGGDADAAVAFGCLLEEGQAVEQSDEGAVAYFSRAADKGHADGQVKLGLMLAAGRGLHDRADNSGQSFNGPGAEGRRQMYALACFMLAGSQGSALGQQLTEDLRSCIPGGGVLPAVPSSGDPAVMLEALAAAGVGGPREAAKHKPQSKPKSKSKEITGSSHIS